jgi:hypothetical protein
MPRARSVESQKARDIVPHDIVLGVLREPLPLELFPDELECCP